MRFTQLVTALIASGMLGACTLTPQDAGSGEEKSLGGVAVDGYLSAATVFIDSNENNILDSWEPYAVTDGQGYFSYNPNTGTNYCDLAGSSHCLKAANGLGVVPVRMTGGYDRITGEKFMGVLTVRMDVGSAVVTSPVTGSPLTSLYEELDATSKALFLSNEGVTSTQVRSDILANATVLRDRSDIGLAVSVTDMAPIELAWRIHKVVEVIAARLEEVFPNTFGGAGQPADATPYVYVALADALMADYAGASPAADLATFFATATNIEPVISAAGSAITTELGAVGGFLPADVTNLAAWASALSGAVTDAFNTTVADKGGVEAAARAIDVVARLMRDTTIALGAVPGSIQNAIGLITGDAAYLTKLRDNKVAVTTLVSDFKSGAITTSAAPIDFTARQTIDSGLTANPDGSKELAMTNNTESAQLTFGASDDPNNTTSGPLEAVIDFSNTDYQFTGDPNEPLTGTWEQVDDFTMVLNIDVADGVSMPVVVKTDPSGVGYTFDLGGDEQTWN